MEKKITNNERIQYLDIAKGISLLLVMISHSCGFPFGTGKYFTAFYIQIFFILSGLTYKSGKSISENIVKRFKGIIIPYFIYSAVILVIYFVLSNAKSVKELIDIVIGVLYSRYCLYPIDYEGENRYFLQIGNSPMWFLTAIFISSCIFYIAMECIKDRKRHLCICSIVFLALTMSMDYLPILLPWSMDTAFFGAFFMLIGYYCKTVYLKEKSWKVLVSVVAMYLICCYFNTGINLSIRQYGDYGIINVIAVSIVGMSGSFLCICFSRMIDFIPVIRDIFAYIGKNTIMLLALHVTIFTIFDGVLARFGISEDVNGIIYYGIGLIRLSVTVGVCYCISCVKKRWIEKVSMH